MGTTKETTVHSKCDREGSRFAFHISHFQISNETEVTVRATRVANTGGRIARAAMEKQGPRKGEAGDGGGVNEKAGGLEALRPGGTAGRLFHGAADGGVRDIGGAFVGRDGVLGFALTDHGQLGLAGRADVLRHFLGGGSGEDLGTFGLAVDFSCQHVGAFGTGHRWGGCDHRCD